MSVPTSSAGATAITRKLSDILQSKYAQVISRNGTAAEGSMANVSYSSITSTDMVESYRKKGGMIVSKLGDVASDMIDTTAENAKGTKLEPLLQAVKNKKNKSSKGKTSNTNNTNTTNTTNATSNTKFGSKSHKDGLVVEEDEDMFCETPYSYPHTPFSRNRALNVSNQKVDSMMFYVRDLLRIEEQSSSRDAVCRKAAERAKDTGQLAVFDNKQASEGLALCCGNHCAMKVGSGTFGSCKATVPLLGIVMYIWNIRLLYLVHKFHGLL